MIDEKFVNLSSWHVRLLAFVASDMCFPLLLTKTLQHAHSVYTYTHTHSADLSTAGVIFIYSYMFLNLFTNIKKNRAAVGTFIQSKELGKFP